MITERKLLAVITFSASYAMKTKQLMERCLRDALNVILSVLMEKDNYSIVVTNLKTASSLQTEGFSLLYHAHKMHYTFVPLGTALLFTTMVLHLLIISMVLITS